MTIHRSLGLCIPLLLCLGTGAGAQDGQGPAAAITVLLMTTDIQVAADGSDTRVQHIEMRAGNDAGAQQIGQISIAFDSAAQDLAVVEAHTLKADGKTLPVDTSAIYEQAPPGQTALIITGLRAKLIVFPQFAAGDTAVYTIKTTTRHPNFPGQFTYAELFARTQAFNEVRETITAPKGFPLYVESHDVEASRRDDGANVVYSWHYAAPRPVAEVPVTFSPLDHTPRFFASSFKDYAQMGRAYAALAEPKRVVTSKIKALADEITAGISDPKAQAQKLYEWVNSHIRYVGIELGTGSFVPRDVDVIVATGYGDCKDHDILLQVLLKARSIDSQSILINGGESYSLTDVPTFTILDHVITFVPQFNLYLDSSAGLAPFGILPLQEYGKPMVTAAAATAGQGKMPVLAPGVAKITLKTVAALDKNGEVTGTTTTTASGPYAIALRALALQIQAAGPTAAARLLTAMGYENANGTLALGAPAGSAPEYAISATFKWNGWGDYVSGKNSFFMPPALRLLGQSGDGIMGPFDPGKLQPGEPTVCFSAEQSEDLSLKAPDGIPFNDVPDNVRVETPNLLFVAQWSLNGDTLSVHRDFTSKIDQPLCTGNVRAQTAAALKRIADSYDVNISFVEGAQSGDATANAARDLYNSGISHFKAEQYELAIADFDKALALKRDFDSLSARGSAYLRLKQYAAAIKDLDDAIQLRQDNYNAYGARAFAHENLGEHELALADYGRAIALKSDDAAPYNERGLVYIRLRQYEAAVADFSKAISLDPTEPDAYSSRAMAEISQRHPDQALADIDKAIALKPDNADAYQLRGMIKANQHQFAAAISDFDKYIALVPGSTAAITQRAGIYVEAKQFALAIADYDRILASQPGNINVLSARAYAHLQAKDYQLAITDYDSVIAKKPDSAEAYLYRGSAKNNLGQKTEGERDIATALKLDPSLNK